MTIIGFNFTKVSAARHKSRGKEKISITRRCVPTDVSEVKIGTGQKAIRYKFEFEAVYTPKVAEIYFEGSISQMVRDEEAKEILDSWTNHKRLPSKTMEIVMNGILSRCHIEALIMSKELNIPPPIRLPTIQVKPGPKSPEKKKAPAKKKATKK